MSDLDQAGGRPRRVAPAALGVLAFYAALAAYAVHRTQFGFDLQDEGLYLAAPLRYALGDLPFRNEIVTPHRMFDVILAPLFYLFPGISVFQLRLVGVGFQLGAPLILFTLLRRFAPDLLAATACGAMALASYRVFTPGYHLLGSSFFLVAWTFWLHGCLGEGRARPLLLGVAAGVCAFLALASYLPFGAVLLVPGLVVLDGLRRGRLDARLVATLAMLITLSLLAGLALLVVILDGLLADWIYADQAVRGWSAYARPLPQMIWSAISEPAPYALPTLVGGVLLGRLLLRLLALRPDDPRWLRFGLLAGAAGVACLVAVAWAPGSWTRALFGLLPATRYQRMLLFPLIGVLFHATLFAIALNLAALLPGPRGWRAPLRGGSWGFVYLCLLGGGLIFAFCQGVVSSQPHKMVFAAVPLFAAGAVGLYRSALQWPGVTHMRERAALALTLVCVTLTFQSLALTRHHFAGEALLGRLDTPFSHPLLSPIRSSAAKVEAIEGALAHLEPHLETGDFLLAYDLVPGFYYLTGTRSAVNTSWLAKDLPLRVRKDALRYMVENGRVPEYCLRARRPFGGPPHAYSQNPSLDPIHAYVSRHYELEAVFEPFEIWKRKPRPQRMPRSREGVGKGVPE